MTEAVTRPKDTETIKRLEKDLLADVPGALCDLYREGGGFTVGIILLPDIKRPTEAHVTVLDGEGAKIDIFTVPADKAHDAFHHTTQYSEPLLLFLGGKEQKKKRGK